MVASTGAHTSQLLAASKPELAKRFGVTRLALFGSTVHDTARADSDADILIAFDRQATSVRYFGVQFYLEDLLDRSVDLVTEKALRPQRTRHRYKTEVPAVIHAFFTNRLLPTCGEPRVLQSHARTMVNVLITSN